MSSVSQLAKENMQRCAEILECEEKIRFYQSRLTQLQEEHRRATLTAALKADACTAWMDTAEDEIWTKENVLAALQSWNRPPALQERYWETLVPDPLRHDRDIFLARLERDDRWREHSYSSGGDYLVLPPQLKADKEVVLKVLEKFPLFAAKENALSPVLLEDFEFARAFLRLNAGIFAQNVSKFSESICNNRELMLEALGAICITPMSLSELGPRLRSDRNFILQAVDAVSSLQSDALKHLPVRLRADKEVVLAFVKQNGKNLAHASHKLRRDMEVVRAACLQQPAALCYCLPSRTKRLLTSNKEYVLNLFHRGEVMSLLSGPPFGVFAICSNALKKDRDIVVAAVASGSLYASSIPEDFQNDRQFWKELLPRKPTAWSSMPPNLQEDRELATLAARNFQEDIDDDGDDGDEVGECVQLILDHCPGVVSDRESAMNMALTGTGDCLESLISANAEFARDREIVLQACRRSGYSLLHVDASLIDDRDIIMVALESNPLALGCVPDFVQQVYPDLVAQAIRDVGLDDLVDVIFEYVDEEMWANREVALAWASRGGDYLDEFFPDDFADDKELFLLFAEHNWGQFEYASKALRGDKDYMLQVVEKDARLLRNAADGLSRDFDLALVAFAGARHLLDEYHHTWSGDVCGCFQFLMEFTASIRSRLYCHDGFVKSILFGMASRISPERTVTILNQGQETSFAYKKLIAEYAGIPMGKELRLLRQASTNLEQWGY